MTHFVWTIPQRLSPEYHKGPFRTLIALLPLYGRPVAIKLPFCASVALTAFTLPVPEGGPGVPAPPLRGIDPPKAYRRLRTIPPCCTQAGRGLIIRAGQEQPVGNVVSEAVGQWQACQRVPQGEHTADAPLQLRRT